MAAISVRDIPDAAYESFKVLAQSEGLSTEARIRQWIIREARNWELQDEQERAIDAARWLRRSDGEFLHGSLTFKVAVVQRDWEAVRYLGAQQETAHGTSALDAADWEYLRSKAAMDGVNLT